MSFTDEEQEKVNKSNVYNDKYIGNLLSLIGTTYFRAVWELNNKVIASSELYQRYLLKQYAKEDVPQTETQWANKQILKKGENRIKALSQNEFSVYIDGEEYSFLSSELKDVRSYVFRINADTPELRIAVEDCLEQLRILYPDYNFSAVYGG